MCRCGAFESGALQSMRRQAGGALSARSSGPHPSDESQAPPAAAAGRLGRSAFKLQLLNRESERTAAAAVKLLSKAGPEDAVAEASASLGGADLRNRSRFVVRILRCGHTLSSRMLF